MSLKRLKATAATAKSYEHLPSYLHLDRPSCNKQLCAALNARFLLQFKVLLAETFKTLSWQSTLLKRASLALKSQAPFSTLKASHIRP